jgi:hypothetical protein
MTDEREVLPAVPAKRVTTYEYKDPLGRLVMKVDRVEDGHSRKVREYHEDAQGRRVNGIDGIQRVLYRIEAWADREEIALCSDEECVVILEVLGFHSTCNPGGTSAWLDAYSSYLSEKRVDIWVDNSDAGEKWLKAVLSSLEGVVKSLRVLRVPEQYENIVAMYSDQGPEKTIESIEKIMDGSTTVSRGVHIPLLSSSECFEIYKKSVKEMDENAVDLGKWLPSLKYWARPLMPGDLALFISDTGVGKTCALTNIAMSLRPMTTILFELELAPEAMCERFISRDQNIETVAVERTVRLGKHYDVSGWSNVFICPESKMDLAKMEEIIFRSELKTQQKARLVLVDYIGLMEGAGTKRYERISDLAEGMKVLARKTKTVIVMASQVKRDPERQEISLHDGKDSGSQENSAQLVLGAWRPAIDRINIKILKQTKRAGQHTIECLFDGDRQNVTELASDEQYV